MTRKKAKSEKEKERKLIESKKKYIYEKLQMFDSK